MALTYDELVRRVPIWLYAENRNLVAEMPVIIEQTQDKLVQMMDHDLFKTIIDGKTVGTDGSVDMSNEDPRVLEIRSVRVKYRGQDDGWTPLRVMDLETLTMMYAKDRPARPRYYAERGGVLQLQLFPKPPEILDLSITANVEPERISVSVQENVYTRDFPRVIEKGAMHFGAIFMKNYQDAAKYEEDMGLALAEAGAQIGRRRRDETSRRQRENKNTEGS